MLDVRDVVEMAAPLTPISLLAMAVQQGADLDRLERLFALKREYEADEARKSYNVAFAEFKAEAVTVIKNRKVTNGPLQGKSYAELFAVVNAVTPALSKHGLSTSWSVTQDTKEWLEVTCHLKHVGGHSERVAMGGPPDAGGAKNAIQARASTLSYLERYSLKAILGISEQEDDNDGGGDDTPRVMPENELADLRLTLTEAKTLKELEAAWRTADQRGKASGDVHAWDALRHAKNERAKALKP